MNAATISSLLKKNVIATLVPLYYKLQVHIHCITHRFNE